MLLRLGFVTSVSLALLAPTPIAAQTAEHSSANAAADDPVVVLASAEMPAASPFPWSSPAPAEPSAASPVIQTPGEKITWKMWLEANGLQPHAVIRTEGSAALFAPVSTQRADARNLFETSLDLDPSKRFGWRGALLHASMHSFVGDDGSASLAGDVQGFSNISALPRTMLFELWLQQNFAGGKLSFKAGKIDANADFAVVENAGNFLQSSMGHSPTLYDMPTYPFARLGAVLTIAPAKAFYLKSGSFTNSTKGASILNEAGVRWTLPGLRLPGRFSYGYWLRTPTEAGLSGNLISSAAGHYLVAEQSVWKPVNGGESRGLAAFFQHGNATPEVSPLRQHLGGGFQWTGLAASRPADVLGLGLALVQISPLATIDPGHAHERSVEAFYLIHCRSWLAVAPDFQYIDHPSGDPLRPNAVVATVRMTVSY